MRNRKIHEDPRGHMFQINTNIVSTRSYASARVHILCFLVRAGRPHPHARNQKSNMRWSQLDLDLERFHIHFEIPSKSELPRNRVAYSLPLFLWPISTRTVIIFAVVSPAVVVIIVLIFATSITVTPKLVRDFAILFVISRWCVYIICDSIISQLHPISHSSTSQRSAVAPLKPLRQRQLMLSEVKAYYTGNGHDFGDCCCNDYKFSKLIVVYFYPRVNSSDTATVSLFDTTGAGVRCDIY